MARRRRSPKGWVRRVQETSNASAMPMLNGFINRGGRGLSSARRARLERAKAELRKLF